MIHVVPLTLKVKVSKHAQAQPPKGGVFITRRSLPKFFNPGYGHFGEPRFVIAKKREEKKRR
jgi:hypothetical protein